MRKVQGHGVCSWWVDRSTIPVGDGVPLEVVEKSAGVARRRVRGGRCKADWIGQRGEPRCSLEPGLPGHGADDCQQRMQVRMGARHGASQGKTEPIADRFGPSSAWPASRDKGHDQGAEYPKDLRLEGKSTCGLRQRRPSSKTIRCVSNLTPPVSWLGPESSGVYPHKGPVVPPAGTGTEYPRPQSGLLAPRSLGASGSPSADGRSTSINGTAAGAIRWSNDLLAPSPDAGQTGRAHRCRRTRALESRAVQDRLPRRQ